MRVPHVASLLLPLFAALAMFTGSVPAPAADVGAAAAQVVQCTNEARASKGLAPMEVDPALAGAAQRFANAMKRRRFFNHTDPTGRDPGDRIHARARGYAAWGENIAQGYPTAHSACRAWMKSHGHRANILNPRLTRIGAGYAPGRSGPYWVEDFATYKPR
jgi:uncharacterized protein YkwD